MQNYKNIVWKYLSILFILFALIVTARFIYDKNHHHYMLERKISHLSADMQQMFQSSQKSLNEKYLMLATQLMSDKEVSELFKHNKRDALYTLLKNNYKEFIHIDKHLHIMHFIDKNNITVLRMHKPSSYADDLTVKRPMAAYVNKSLIQQNAFEVGKNGIVYRITVPFYYNNEHIGILEFGVEPSNFVDAINKQYKLESELLVKNESLNVLVTKKEYKQLDEYSIITQSTLFKNISPMIDLTKDTQIIKYESKYYIIFTNLNLHNYQNEKVAKVLIAKDITTFISKNSNSLFVINTITIAVMLFIFLFLYILFTKYINEINSYILKTNSLQKQSKYLEKRANRDNLTNAHNKEYLNKYLVDFLKINRNGIILFFDIDDFKNCNDTHGHLIGDEILIQLSKTIQEYLRSGDLFVRWGGEEFTILFEDISSDIALRKAESIRLLVEKTRFTDNIPITISIGITNIKDDDTITSLLNRVDNLLYSAKKSGKNKVVSDI